MPVTPSMFAHVPRELGRDICKVALMIRTTKACTKHTTATMMARMNDESSCFLPL